MKIVCNHLCRYKRTLPNGPSKGGRKWITFTIDCLHLWDGNRPIDNLSPAPAKLLIPLCHRLMWSKRQYFCVKDARHLL